jgi:hypothetical protein
MNISLCPRSSKSPVQCVPEAISAGIKRHQHIADQLYECNALGWKASILIFMCA